MNKQDLVRIKKLPDILPGEIIKKELRELTNIAKVANRSEYYLLLEAYFELSERQWHTYKLLDSVLLKEIDSILINLWDSECLESTENIIGIIGMLGLQKTYQYIKKSLSKKLLKDIRQEILEAVEEFGDTVEDPYLNLE